ncbi:hypothetical protein B0H15DRAFT_814914 [Mycena belliarum]|uniref:Uncharacterized protein n=1 Tax=Mycena belliarum TaxID=1033014 RepID=A0AAD6UGE0_9AGAR|nr:hypothetical protein B0H15DRAFT_814914 [Mycena belliae]
MAGLQNPFVQGVDGSMDGSKPKGSRSLGSISIAPRGSPPRRVNKRAKRDSLPNSTLPRAKHIYTAAHRALFPHSHNNMIFKNLRRASVLVLSVATYLASLTSPPSPVSLSLSTLSEFTRGRVSLGSSNFNTTSFKAPVRAGFVEIFDSPLSLIDPGDLRPGIISPFSIDLDIQVIEILAPAVYAVARAIRGNPAAMVGTVAVEVLRLGLQLGVLRLLEKRFGGIVLHFLMSALILFGSSVLHASVRRRWTLTSCFGAVLTAVLALRRRICNVRKPEVMFVIGLAASVLKTHFHGLSTELFVQMRRHTLKVQLLIFRVSDVSVVVQQFTLLVLLVVVNIYPEAVVFAPFLISVATRVASREGDQPNSLVDLRRHALKLVGRVAPEAKVWAVEALHRTLVTLLVAIPIHSLLLAALDGFFIVGLMTLAVGRTPFESPAPFVPPEPDPDSDPDSAPPPPPRRKKRRWYS